APAAPDIAWLRPDATAMHEADWDNGFGRSVAVFLNGRGIPDLDLRGQPVVDDSFLLCFNAHDEAITFSLPAGNYAPSWTVALSSAELELDPAAEVKGELPVPARSVVVLRSAEA